MGNAPPKEVFNVIEEKDGKTRWVRIGTAFVNRDGSINALLNVYPREGKLQIRDRRRRQQEGGNGQGQTGQGQ
jgi:hypothetical protein